MTQSNNRNAQNNNTGNQKRNFNQRRENQRSNFRKNTKNDFYKKPQRYNSDSMVARIAKPKREESVEDIRMDIEKLEKEIQFEIKQIRSVKLGL